MEITIYDKNGEEVASVVVGSGSYVLTQIMGDSYLQLEFKAGDYLDIRRDSYVMYENVKYTLTTAVNVEKISTCEYDYTARFEAPQELLENVIFSHMAEEDQTTTKAYERNFSLAATAKEHLDMLLLNTARLDANFTDVSVDPSLTGVKVIGYNVVSCKAALQLIANAFETEWWISGNEGDGYTINLGKCSFDESTPTKLAYGFDNGVLGRIPRKLHKDAQRMTHILVQGGSQNINTLSQLTDENGVALQPYKFSTLHLPLIGNEKDGIGTIYYDIKNNKFDGETGFDISCAVMLYIDRNSNSMTSSLFNKGEDVIVERAYDMSEFYPKKTRNVTSWGFNANNSDFWVIDDSIETACNYSTYQLGGEKMEITFQTGALAGKSFEVKKYDHNTHKFTCSLADYDTISMPSASEDNSVWRPVVDDEFIVFGCALPTTYFHDTTTDPFSGAEWDMCRRAASILCDNFEDKYAYTLLLDSNWFSRRTATERAKLKTGYWVHFIDSQLCGGGVDIRITDVKQYLTRPLQPELTVGDEVKTVSVAQKLQQVSSNVSATYNYVKDVQQETQQAIQQVQEQTFTQVQANWDETDETSAAYIQNKPEVINGKDGADGKDGAAAGFGSVTASIDANSGTPTVSVTTSGSNTAKNFSFVFKNLKGTKGDKGETGANGRDGIDGKDGTSVTILGSYDTLAALQAAHPSGNAGDSYMIGQYLYVWNGSAWQNVGQIKGEDGKDGKDGTNGTNGKDGADGVSCTHVWNGTVLTITSASGTSSVDLKGATGAKGADGKDGKDAVPLIDTSFPDSASDERVPSTKLVKTQLAAKSNSGHKHSASDITSGTLAVSRGGTGKTTLESACNAFINALSTGTSTPTDNDYVITQYVGGGTSTTTYHRRPISKIWEYIKGKADLVYSALNHTHDDRYYTEDEVTTKLSGKSDTSHNHDSVYEKKVTRWNAYEGVSGTGNQYIIFATLTHTPKQYHEWSFSVRIRGEHNSMHGETTLRVYGTDLNSTTIINPTMTYLEGAKSMPIVRAYRVSDTQIAFGIFKANEWAKCSVELLSVVSTSVTAVSSQTDTRTNDTAYLSQVSQTEFSKLGHTHSKSDITDLTLPTIVTSVPLQPSDTEIYAADLSKTEFGKCIKNNESGTITSSTITPLTLKRSTTAKVRMMLANNNGNLGAIVAGTDYLPYWYDGNLASEDRIVLKSELQKRVSTTWKWSKSGTGADQFVNYHQTGSAYVASNSTNINFLVSGLSTASEYNEFVIKYRIRAEEKRVYTDGTAEIKTIDPIVVNVVAGSSTYIKCTLPNLSRLEPEYNVTVTYVSIICDEM